MNLSNTSVSSNIVYEPVSSLFICFQSYLQGNYPSLKHSDFGRNKSNKTRIQRINDSHFSIFTAPKIKRKNWIIKIFFLSLKNLKLFPHDRLKLKLNLFFVIQRRMTLRWGR